MRPSVVVECYQGLMGSTFGVPVINPLGERHITLANHGFSCYETGVYYPLYDNLVGSAMARHPRMDNALAQLLLGLFYSLASFDGTSIERMALETFVPWEVVKLVKNVYMDLACNGKCSGIVIVKSLRVVEKEDIKCQMCYFGNGARGLVPKSYDSALWTLLVTWTTCVRVSQLNAT